jgi:hypothetical protein
VKTPRFIAANQHGPLQDVEEELRSAWGDGKNCAEWRGH